LAGDDSVFDSRGDSLFRRTRIAANRQKEQIGKTIFGVCKFAGIFTKFVKFFLAGVLKLETDKS
jgi:hypothetical protein